MTLIRAAVLPALFLIFLLLPRQAAAQALPTATQTTHLSAFAGGTGVYTNFYGGRNLSITAGADLTISSFRGYHPSIEVRGTYPFHNGSVDSQKSALAGIRIDRQFNNLRPYVNFLIGRGEIDYQNGGYQPIGGNITYISSTTNVYSPGGGLDYDLTDHFSVKVDLQAQFWNAAGDTPAPSMRGIHPIAGTLAIVYRFGNNHPSHRIPPPPPPATPQPPTPQQ